MGTFSDSTQQYKERFQAFTEELAKLSEKHGVTIRSCGGVDIYDLDQVGNLKVEYSKDWTSGDLEVDVYKKTNSPAN